MTASWEYWRATVSVKAGEIDSLYSRLDGAVGDRDRTLAARDLTRAIRETEAALDKMRQIVKTQKAR